MKSSTENKKTYRWAGRSNRSNVSPRAFWTLNGKIVTVTTCRDDAIYSNVALRQFQEDRGTHDDLVVQCFHPLQARRHYHLIRIVPAGVEEGRWVMIKLLSGRQR